MKYKISQIILSTTEILFIIYSRKNLTLKELFIYIFLMIYRLSDERKTNDGFSYLSQNSWLFRESIFVFHHILICIDSFSIFFHSSIHFQLLILLFGYNVTNWQVELLPSKYKHIVLGAGITAQWNANQIGMADTYTCFPEDKT